MLLNVCPITNNQNSTNLSRYELLDWLNGQLCSNFKKIDDLCTGAAFCQLLHMLRPEAINLKRVKFRTNIEWEYIQNFKLLQVGFQQEYVKKEIPIERLVKGHYQDNLEFVRWFKTFHDLNYEEGSVYDAKAARDHQIFGVEQAWLKPKQIRLSHTALNSVNSLMARNVSNASIKSEMISGVKGRNKKGPIGSQLEASGMVVTLPLKRTIAVNPTVRVFQSNLETQTNNLTRTLTEVPTHAAPSDITSPNIESDLMEAGVSHLPLPPSGNQPRYVLKGAASQDFSNKCIQVDNSKANEDQRGLTPSHDEPGQLQDNDAEPARSIPNICKCPCWSKCCCDGRIRLVMHADKYEKSNLLIIKSVQERINQIIQEETQKEVASETEIGDSSDISSDDTTTYECICIRPNKIFECQRCLHYIQGRFVEVCQIHPMAEFPMDFSQCPYCLAPIQEIEEASISLDEFKKIEEAKLPNDPEDL